MTDFSKNFMIRGTGHDHGDCGNERNNKSVFDEFNIYYGNNQGEYKRQF